MSNFFIILPQNYLMPLREEIPEHKYYATGYMVAATGFTGIYLLWYDFQHLVLALVVYGVRFFLSSLWWIHLYVSPV